MHETGDTEAFLISAESSMQADILESKLKFYGIPVMRKYKESGGYLQVYMGANPFGVDLYVPSSQLTAAKELIENSSGQMEPDDNMKINPAEVADECNTEYKNNRRSRARLLIVILLVIPFVILIVYELIQMIIKLANWQL